MNYEHYAWLFPTIYQFRKVFYLNYICNGWIGSCWHLPVAWCFSFSPSLGCCFSLIFDRDLLRHILFLEKHFLEEICILIILVTEFHFEELLFVFYLLFIYYCIVLYRVVRPDICFLVILYEVLR